MKVKIPITTKVLTSELGWINASEITSKTTLFGNVNVKSVVNSQGESYDIKLSGGNVYKALGENKIPLAISWKAHNTVDDLVYKTINEIKDDYIKYYYKNNVISQTAKKYYVPFSKISHYENRNHVINGYALGVLLSEGTLGRVKRGVLRVTNGELDVLKNFEESSGLYGRQSVDKYHHNYPSKRNVRAKIVRDEITRLGLNVNTEFKFIPNEYIYDSYENRLNILRGLIDGDGTICIRDGRNTYSVSFSTSSPYMVKSFSNLIKSMGMSYHVGKGKKYRFTNVVIEILTGEKIWNSIKHSNRAKGKHSGKKGGDLNSRSIIDINYTDIVECVTIETDGEIETDNRLIYNNYSEDY